MIPSSSPDHSPRLFASLRQLLATATGMALTRLALAGLELEEELQRLMSLLLGVVGVLVFGTLGLVMLTLAVVLAVDPAQRVTVLALFAVAYLGVGGWALWRIKQAMANRPPFLQATLAEMAKDSDALHAATHPEPAP